MNKARQIYLDDSDWEKLCQAAVESGLSPSDFVNHWVAVFFEYNSPELLKAIHSETTS